MTFQRLEIGRRGEDHALAHYVRSGFELVERNSRTRHGEIDLIVRSSQLLVICEVRTRVAGRGNPLESFNPGKVLQVRRMAAGWLASRPRSAQWVEVRLDAAAVTVDPRGELVSLEVLEGAL